MFKTAKIKLTVWYLVVIMFISVFLSFLIYRGVNTITNRALIMQTSRMERRWQHQQQLHTPKPIFEVETFMEIRKNLFWSLVRINLLIFLVSGVSGYFLAGRTLKPIEEMVEEQKRFISNASHELKTPLTALKTELEVTLRGKDHKRAELLNIIKSNLDEVNKLHKLAESLLKESRYKKDNYSILFESVNLKNLVEDVSSGFSKKAARKNVKISHKLLNLTVLGNELSLGELVSILIDNAIKFSPKNSAVTLGLRKDKKYAILQVSDKGVGILKSEQPYIFNRFYQVETSRTKVKNEGFGLGLSIAKKITELHNGTISVLSDSGKGSTFTVKIPLA